MTTAAAGEAARVPEVSVLVIGAGYAGVIATNRLLASLTPWRLTGSASWC